MKARDPSRTFHDSSVEQLRRLGPPISLPTALEQLRLSGSDKILSPHFLYRREIYIVNLQVQSK